jgi:hypothetical protein
MPSCLLIVTLLRVLDEEGSASLLLFLSVLLLFLLSGVRGIGVPAFKRASIIRRSQKKTVKRWCFSEGR